VLLSDIQGFTSMVEAFQQRSAAGVEEVTSALNGYVAVVVETVDRFGGDVIAIAGDSFLCYWSAVTDLTLDEAAVRSCQAGLAIQAALHDREAAHNIRFRTRIGIGAGPVLVAFVGGAGGKWECLLSGGALDAAVRAEALAEPGAVILSPQARQEIRLHGRVVAAAEDHGLLEAIDLPPPPLPPPQPSALATPNAIERLQPYVPRAVQHRMALPSARWLLEFRPVTLFLASVPPISSTTASLAESLAHTHALIHTFQLVVEEFGGMARVDIDAKGALLFGLWGLPPQAHEHDALLAVEASLALHARAPGGHLLSIGVATGRALCGAFCSTRRSDYIVRGSVINVAARLMQSVRGDVLADAATVNAARHRLVFEPRPPLQVKGLAKPVSVVRPRGRRWSMVAADGPIIGRSDEELRLGEALEALVERQIGSTWLIQAEAGLGKSLLVQVIANQAIARGVTVLVASADAIDARTALAAWRNVVRELLGGGEVGDLQRALEQRLQGLPHLARLAPLLSDVVPIGLADSVLTAEMVGEARAENTRRLLAGLLTVFAQERPTLLIFEDGHWADSVSRDLLADLAALAPPVLTMVTTRPPERDHAVLLADVDDVRRLRLSTLQDEDIDRLICSELGVRRAPLRLLRWIRERVAGHPYFAVELVRALRSSGAVTLEDGRCSVGELDALGLPLSIEGAITGRLNQLSPKQQLTLKVAAVIGRSFSETMLLATHPACDAEVSGHLSTFVDRAITSLIASHEGRAYEFRHGLVRDVVYEQMTRSQRKLLHQAVAAWLQQGHAGQLHTVAAKLAEHWECAEDAERALQFTELAGDHALRSGAFPEAVKHFRRALLICQQAPLLVGKSGVARLEIGLGMAAYFLGDYQESRRLLEIAVSQLDRAVPASDSSAAMALLRAALVQIWHRLFGVRSLTRGQQQVSIEVVTECYRVLAQIYFLQGESALRLAYLTIHGVNVGEHAGDSVSLARALANLGALLSLIGLKKVSEWYGRASVAMAERKGQYAAGAYVRHIGAVRLVTNGHVEEALQSSAEALSRLEALGDFNLELEVTSVQAMIAATNGHFEIAAIAARRCLALARRTGSLVLGGWAQLNLVDVALDRDDIPAAQAELAEGRALLAGRTDLATRILLLRAEAILARHERRWADALRHARDLISEIGTTMPTAYYLADACAVAARVLADGAGAGQAVSRSELQRASRTVRRLARNYWNIRNQAASLDAVLKRLDK